jgi:hypothetical protein
MDVSIFTLIVFRSIVHLRIKPESGGIPDIDSIRIVNLLYCAGELFKRQFVVAMFWVCIIIRAAIVRVE